MKSYIFGILTMLDALILDATPLITQTAAQLKPYAKIFYTTPGVHSELRDENAKTQLLLWGDSLVVRQPKQKYIDLVWAFSRKSGDNQVLSINDVHIIALSAEIHDELTKKNNLDRLRTFPGEIREIDQIRINQYKEKKELERKLNPEKFQHRGEEIEEFNGPVIDDDGFEVVVNKKKNKNNSHKTKIEPEPIPVVVEEEPAVSEETPDDTTTTEEQLNEEFSPEDDDGEWITEDNLVEMVVKDSDNVEAEVPDANKDQVLSALSTGDYACQNVSLQMGIHLLNSANGKQIKRVRNYMLRCHACFEMFPIPKDGSAKQFCDSCGGATLRRIPVSVNGESGKITPHLSKNFQWITRGNVYSTPNPLSKRYQKKYGNKGFNHVKGSMENDYHSEDQKEYQTALKSAQYQMQKHEKEMMDYVSSGSAENVISPFSTGGGRTIKVKVGRGKYANMSKRK